jgi:hypothetical protein
MANSIKEKLTDLQKQARENLSTANRTIDVIQQYIDNGGKILSDITCGKDFFVTIAFLNAQKKAPKIEDFIRNKLQHNPVRKEENKGDGVKDGIYYEYKISTTNKNEQLNALQIRLEQEIDYYLLGYIDEKEFENSRLYLVPHCDMKSLCNKYGIPTHGTKNDEISFRIKMKIDNDLLKLFEQQYRTKKIEKIIFN